MKLSEDIYLVADGMIGLSNPYDCHVYIVDCGAEKIMIDVGGGLEPEEIVTNIKNDNIDLNTITKIILTHAHADHAAGAKFFKEKLNAEVWINDVESKLLENGTDEELGLNMVRGSVYPSDYKYIHCKVDRTITDQEETKIGKYNIKFIQVPGHSPGITCLLLINNNRRIMFSADVVFATGNIALGNWNGSNLKDYRENIDKLKNMNVDELYPGHFLWLLKNGQIALNTAIANLKKPWPPPNFGHNYPHF
tara:strand:+ start:496 stop:1245 length:750 start_codon:yes stop_codon:yes gene_type:complete